MTLQEFAALKPGDKIDNLMSNSRGTVTELKPEGVMIAWGANSIVTFFYAVSGTAWMHWSKVKMCPSGVPCTSNRCEAVDQCLGGDYDAIAGVCTK